MVVECKVVELSGVAVKAAALSLTRASRKMGLGLDISVDDQFDSITPSGIRTMCTLAVYEAGEDSEPLGFFVTDLQTFQWRNVYSQQTSGVAAQGLKGAAKLLAGLLPR